METHVRFLTAASLFDGHDVSVNIMRRLLQSKGAEVIHLGHNRSAAEVAEAALCEDVQAVALSSYQGGHMEYFKYVRDLLNAGGGEHIKIFGGGGGVITPKEIEKLHSQGINKIYSPQDGMKLGLEGIIEDMIQKSQFNTTEDINFNELRGSSLSRRELSWVITAIEETGDLPLEIKEDKGTPVLGITGTGGAGKSSLIDEIMLRFRRHYVDKKIALISIDPSKKRTKGALLGDRIRLGNCSGHENFFIRSLATRNSKTELSPQIKKVVQFLKSQDFDLIMIETSGIGQASDEITRVSDKCMYVMTPEFGAQTQLEKIEMLEAADVICINKFEKPRGLDAFRDVKKQYRRNHQLFNMDEHPDDTLPVFGTIASKYNDPGVNALFKCISELVHFPISQEVGSLKSSQSSDQVNSIIPASNVQYLRLIADTCRQYDKETDANIKKLQKYEVLKRALEYTDDNKLKEGYEAAKKEIEANVFADIEAYNDLTTQYLSGEFTYQVRGKDIKVKTKYTSLSGLEISRVGFPVFEYESEKYKFLRNSNLPGFFPYSSGIFPFKRKDEEPKRQFAGEGGPGRTNKRFHYLSEDDPSKRLSTAFDSVTLYGEDPDQRPDIYGKVGESGVSVATLKDMEDLFEGFDLTSPSTSVSMTINGPAPIILAMYFNAAINQKLKGSDQNDPVKRLEIIQQLRGTVQADILKEDQAQNTCIFSLEFALKLMGDVQAYFCKNTIKNYYSVSISGYHIAEAGANPITQLAFTLANGFTYVEYYLSRGMDINDFSQNLSFFFSNGLDPEYTVMGRVARKIWAVALRDRYGANEKAQKLKYHIQTSGRSLHAQEIDFNDIRTTLQALLALSDNCNSLHTNAYDEAITTPTEESVRRAMAIQLIVNREFGFNKTDNPMQGSYIVEELCDLVQEAVLKEFEAISDRGGVLGAMESMYQRSKIQEESLYYESLKDKGDLPIIGVNTFLAKNAHDQEAEEIELTRASYQEKNQQIDRLKVFQDQSSKRQQQLAKLREVALQGGNIFEELMETVRHCSLGEITHTLFEVGGRYRRNM